MQPVKVNWKFGGTYHLHLQGQGLREARSHHEAGIEQSSVCCLLYAGFLLFSIFVPEDGDNMFLQNVS
jgi:hypothetical protein